MIVAVQSGKGGTGKTTVAVNLASVMGWRYLDCDIEEPNGWAFLQPKLERTEEVKQPAPVIARELCTGCAACCKACQFQALGITSSGVLSFPLLCHGCGLCSLVCPVGAITEQPRAIGRIDRGLGQNGLCWQGVLNVGEPSGVPIIEQMLRSLSGAQVALLDCSPGTSCNAVAAAKAADLALLVTESTPFGAHDLRLSIELVRSLGLPAAIVVNRSTGDDHLIWDLAAESSLPIVATLPFSREVAAACAAGKLIDDRAGRQRLRQLGNDILELLSCS